MNETEFVEKRSQENRRQSSFPRIFGGGLRRRRSKGRRKTDKGAYVDIYDLRSWIFVISILILSLLDAVLTGFHVLEGTAREANPFMNAILKQGGLWAFFGAKAALTTIPLAIILLHKEWLWGKFALWICLWSYALLSIYHILFLVQLNRILPYLRNIT
jgi:hypothetical protein